jgi:hypothetical protein
MTGSGTAASLGFPDFGLTTMTEMVENAARIIARSVSLPVISDADTGYGNELNVTRTVREFEARNVAAIHIEDQVAPKRCGHLDGKEVVPRDEFVSKIRGGAAGAPRPRLHDHRAHRCTLGAGLRRGDRARQRGARRGRRHGLRRGRPNRSTRWPRAAARARPLPAEHRARRQDAAVPAAAGAGDGLSASRSCRASCCATRSRCSTRRSPRSRPRRCRPGRAATPAWRSRSPASAPTNGMRSARASRAGPDSDPTGPRRRTT